MAYLVLARKYRPQVFADIVGQDHLIQTLENAITGGRVAHAYLFCGPRGVGKTTAARILAKALNCENGPTPVPCNTCGTCREITEGRSLDVLEIDGASNRGINEVRELRENVRYAPSGQRSKVYIIDEVHMLTTEAFNALLKTLEEPPAHVVFVFATTEPFKVPATILSRVQRFDFARIPARKIAEHLGAIAEKEGIDAAPEALSLVARRAKGGLRDALSLMDQVISAAQGAIDRETVERLLGLVGGDFYYSLIDRLAEEDVAGAFQLLDTTYTQGADLGDLAEGLATHLRDLLLVRLSDSLVPLLDAPPSEVPRLQTQAGRFSRETLVELVDRAAEVAAGLRRNDHPRLTLELALAEMAEQASRMPLGELAERLLALEARMGGAPGPAAPGPSPDKPARSPSSKPAGTGASGQPARAGKPDQPGKTARPGETARPGKPAKPTQGAAAPGAGKATELWVACVEASREKGMALFGMLQGATAVDITAQGHLVVRPAATPGAGTLLAAKLADGEIQGFLTGILKGLGLSGGRVVLEGSGDAGGAAATPPAATAAEPAAGEPPRLQAKPEEDTRSMGQIFKDEPLLQKALDMFDGEVLP